MQLELGEILDGTIREQLGPDAQITMSDPDSRYRAITLKAMEAVQTAFADLVEKHQQEAAHQRSVAITMENRMDEALEIVKQIEAECWDGDQLVPPSKETYSAALKLVTALYRNEFENPKA
jgi:hypothetical protein